MEALRGSKLHEAALTPGLVPLFLSGVLGPGVRAEPVRLCTISARHPRPRPGASQPGKGLPDLSPELSRLRQALGT